MQAPTGEHRRASPTTARTGRTERCQTGRALLARELDRDVQLGRLDALERRDAAAPRSHRARLREPPTVRQTGGEETGPHTVVAP